MKVYSEISLSEFDAWGDAPRTLERLENTGKLRQVEAIIEEEYPDGMTRTELNDLLWFDADTVYEWAGLPTESTIRSEMRDANNRLNEIEEEIADLRSEYDDLCIGLSEADREELYIDNYDEDIAALKVEADELRERLEELEEELEQF